MGATEDVGCSWATSRRHLAVLAYAVFCKIAICVAPCGTKHQGSAVLSVRATTGANWVAPSGTCKPNLLVFCSHCRYLCGRSARICMCAEVGICSQRTFRCNL